MKQHKAVLLGTFTAAIFFMQMSELQAQTAGIGQVPGVTARIALGWSTRVHHQMLRDAFPKENRACVHAMQEGSDYTDKAQFQHPRYSYMHAMRAKGQSAAEAAEMMQRFIEQNFTLARRAGQVGNDEQRCFYRGVALHPVMDSTSPAHRGFQEWDPIPFQSLGGVLGALLSPRDLRQKLPHMLKHGDLVKRITDYLPAVGDTSLEDYDYLDDHPQLMQATVEYMRDVDRIQYELMRELER